MPINRNPETFDGFVQMVLSRDEAPTVWQIKEIQHPGLRRADGAVLCEGCNADSSVAVDRKFYGTPAMHAAPLEDTSGDINLTYCHLCLEATWWAALDFESNQVHVGDAGNGTYYMYGPARQQ